MNEILTVEQSQSTNNRQRTKSESCVYSKIIRRSSQQFSSIENLESLITCSIHLGLINEPRQLPCGHAFCYSCLKNYLSSYSKPEEKYIICPLCRYETKLDSFGLDQLAPSVVHKQLTDYLILKRQKLLDNSIDYCKLSSENDKNLKEIKLNLMRHLMTDFKNEMSTDSESDIENQLNSILLEHTDTINRSKGRIRSFSESFDRAPSYGITPKASEVYHHLDQNSIRKNMRKYREYKLIKSLIHPKKSNIRQVSWIDHDRSNRCSNHSEVMIFILSNSSLIYISNLEGTTLREFKLNVDGYPLSPFFVKCHEHELFVVGSLEKESVLLKVSLQGLILKISSKYVGFLGGFFVDNKEGNVIVAYPSSHSVVILDRDSLEEIKVFNFGDLSPMYVTRSSNSREIWVSCPDNGRIAVYDEVQDHYLHLDTNQIYESLPTHINETKDHRILFLDSTWSRVFWIRRWNNQLYIQLLIVFGVNEEMELKSLEPISENMIMLSNNQWTYIAKPSRSVKEEHRKEKCVLL